MNAKAHTSSQSILRRLTPVQRFWMKVQKTSKCWLWLGAVSDKRYGSFHPCVGTAAVKAHKYAYELKHGSVPDGLQLDHKCRNTLCVRPSHLRLSTGKQNCANRSQAIAKRERLRVGRCLHGHDLSLHWNEKYQRCWECNRIRSRRYQQIKRGVLQQ